MESEALIGKHGGVGSKKQLKEIKVAADRKQDEEVEGWGGGCCSLDKSLSFYLMF